MVRMSEILVICSGNICRSPLAERMLRASLDATDGGRSIATSSAGTLGIEGKPADPHSVTAAEEIGIPLDDHRSRGLTLDRVREADVLLVMEDYHADFARMLDASCADKIVRLWEHARLPQRLHEIPDPVGESIEAFRECRDLLARCLGHWLPTWLRAESDGDGDIEPTDRDGRTTS